MRRLDGTYTCERSLDINGTVLCADGRRWQIIGAVKTCILRLFALTHINPQGFKMIWTCAVVPVVQTDSSLLVLPSVTFGPPVPYGYVLDMFENGILLYFTKCTLDLVT